MSEEQGAESQVEEGAPADESSEDERLEARELGWAPKERWKGKPEDWIDARQFLERSRQMMPVLRATNQKLEGRLRDQGSLLQQTQEQLRQTNAALRALEESHEEIVEERAADDMAELEARIEQASADGDHRAVARLTREMVKLEAKTLAKPAGKGEGEGDPPPRRTMPPEFRQWFADHDDYVSGKKAALLGAEMQEMRAGGDARTGIDFLDEARSRVEEFLGGNPAGGASRVNGGNGGTGRKNGGAGGSGRSFADLPADAKATAERMAPRFVGPGKKYKDAQAWRNAYAVKYFEQE